MTSEAVPFETRLAAAKALALTAWSDLAAHWRRPSTPVALLWPLWCALGFLAVVVMICIGLAFDESVARAAPGLPPALVGFFETITHAGKSNWLFALPLLVIAFGLYARDRVHERRERASWGVIVSGAFYFVSVMAFSGLASQVVKHLLARARPRLIDAMGPFHFDYFSWKAVLASFPSGHTTTVFAAFGALTLLAPRLGPAFLIVAIPVAASRLIVGAHYPSDVCAGLFLGLGSALAVARIFARKRIAFTLAPEALLPKPRGAGLIRSAMKRPQP